jgi:hypothetical protein
VTSTAESSKKLYKRTCIQRLVPQAVGIYLSAYIIEFKAFAVIECPRRRYNEFMPRRTAAFAALHDQTNLPDFLSQFLDCFVISYEDAFEKIM